LKWWRCGDGGGIAIWWVKISEVEKKEDLQEIMKEREKMCGSDTM